MTHPEAVIKAALEKLEIAPQQSIWYPQATEDALWFVWSCAREYERKMGPGE